MILIELKTTLLIDYQLYYLLIFFYTKDISNQIIKILILITSFYLIILFVPLIIKINPKIKITITE